MWVAPRASVTVRVCRLGLGLAKSTGMASRATGFSGFGAPSQRGDEQGCPAGEGGGRGVGLLEGDELELLVLVEPPDAFAALGRGGPRDDGVGLVEVVEVEAGVVGGELSYLHVCLLRGT